MVLDYTFQVYQLLLGAVLNDWLLAPALYYGKQAVWIGGLRLYTTNQTILTSDDLALYPDGGVRGS
jgi:hypothetical protein